MNFQEFLEKFNGQPVDTDGVYPNQCMDLMHSYVYNVLGITDLKILAHPSACQVFDNFTEDKYFDKIANTPTGVPQEGDIVVFKCVNALPFGHVCIFIEGDENKFKSFDANWPTGSLPHVQDHTYGYCAGWLHPKGALPDLQAQLDEFRIERDRNWNWFVVVCDALGVGANVDAAVNEAKKLVNNDDLLVMRDKQIAEANTQITDLQTQFTIKSQMLADAQIQVATLTVEVEKSQKTIDSLTQQTKDDQKTLQTLKDSLTKPPVSGLQKILEGFLELFGKKI